MKYQLVLLTVLVTLLNSCQKQNDFPVVDVYGHAAQSLHRDRTVFPANSYESVQYAIDVLNTEGVEIDIQMTKDSVLVLFHDSYLSESTLMDGCVSQYNYNELKDLTLDFTSYKLTTLKSVLELTKSRNVKVYIDAKIYSFCDGKTSISAFQYALNQSTQNLDSTYKNNVYLGMSDLEFLKSITYPIKCFESNYIGYSTDQALASNFKAVIFNVNLIGDEERTFLNNSGLYWGISGIKDKWSIDQSVALKPKFVITDNISYTLQVTN